MQRIENYIQKWSVLSTLLFFVLVVRAQTGEGGGVYIESGGKLSSSLVIGNKASEGFGVAGKDGWLLNCTVVENRSEKGIRNGIKPGDVFCLTGEVMDLGTYEKRGIWDAMGVVFWVNSDPFATYPAMYVMALQEDYKAFGENVGPEVNFALRGTADPVADTACYGQMDWLLSLTGDWKAAEYCRDFRVEGQPAQVKWVFPAGYQMMAMFMNRLEVSKTLVKLNTLKPGSARNLTEGIYWTASVDGGYDGLNGWVMNFGDFVDGVGSMGVITTSGTSTAVDQQYWVRPVFVYGY